MIHLRLPVIAFLSLLTGASAARGQSITNADGSPLTTRYCYEEGEHELKGLPSGGTFSGCGMFSANGAWYFNPVQASAGTTVFPYQCVITYTVNNTSTSRTILVQKPVKINPPLLDLQTCDGSFSLTAYTLYAGAYDYRWEPAGFLDNPDTSLTDGHIDQTTTFIITAEDHVSGCRGSDTLTIHKRPYPEVSVTPQQTIITSRETVQLKAEGAATYSWPSAQWLSSDRIANPIASPRETVTYTVVGRNEYGCADTAQATIQVLDKLFIPNAFSPNGDGKNDVFRIENFGYQNIEAFSIFNRWGNLVFETRDGLSGWNGLIKGREAESGTYFYYIKVNIADGRQPKVFKGDVLLIR